MSISMHYHCYNIRKYFRSTNWLLCSDNAQKHCWSFYSGSGVILERTHEPIAQNFTIDFALCWGSGPGASHFIFKVHLPPSHYRFQLGMHSVLSSSLRFTDTGHMLAHVLSPLLHLAHSAPCFFFAP